MVFTLILAASFCASTLACADHANIRRQVVSSSGSGDRQIARTIPQDREHDWDYAASYNWGSLNESESN